MGTTLSSTVLGYVDAAYGTGERSTARAEIGIVGRFRPRRLSDGEIVPRFVSWRSGGYRRVLSRTPADATTFTIDATARTVTRSAGSFVDEDFYVGQLVGSDGWSNGANNSAEEAIEVTALSALVMTWGNEASLVNEGPTAGTTVSIQAYHRSPPRMDVPRVVCSMVNSGWGTERGANRPAPESDLFLEYEQFRIGVLEEGEIHLLHADHDREAALNDWVTDYGWGDAECLLYIGRIIDPWSAWEPFFPFKVTTDPTWNRAAITLFVKSAVVNLNLPAQTAVLEGDEIDATLAGFSDPANRPYYAVAFPAEEDATPKAGYTELGEVSGGAGANRMTLSTGWHATLPNESPGASWASANRAGLIAVEIASDGGVIAATHIETSQSGAQVTSYLTGSRTPSASQLQLLAVHSLIQSNIAGGPDPVVNPNAPTVAGCSLTWVEVATILYDSDGTANRARETLFRALGTPATGQVTVSFGGQQQQRVQVSWTEFDNVLTTGTDGSDAVVQSATESVVGTPAQPVSDSAIGQTKPVTLGHARSVPAVRTNPSHWIVSDAVDGLEAIDAIYAPPGVDVKADAALSLADGGFVLDTDAGELVCDVRGEKFDGGVYSAEQGKVTGELFDRNGILNVFNAADLAALTREIGLHIPADNAGILRDWCEFALKPDGIPYPKQDGTEYRVWTIEDPTGQTADVTYSGTNEIADIERLVSAPPATLVRVGYQHQWAVLRGVADSGGEDQEPIDPRLFSPWQWATANDPTILTNYPNALRLTIQSPLYSAADAQAAADALLAILKVKRDLLRVRVAKKLLYAWLGSYVSIIYPGYGLSGGKVFACVGVEYDLQVPSVWLYLWG